jgi:hypothetical protein
MQIKIIGAPKYIKQIVIDLKGQIYFNTINSRELDHPIFSSG